MRAIILAAGRGSRMGTLTEERPKCRVEFGGRSLLSWQQNAFTAAGISDVGIVTGYLRETFSEPEFTYFQNARWATSNMVRSLQCARAWLSTEPCVVSYSDIFYETEAVQTLVRSRSELAILYDVNWQAQWKARFADPLSDAETFRLDSSGRLCEIGNPAGSLDEIEGQYMGLLYFTPPSWRRVSDFLDALSPEVVDLLSMTGLLSRLIAAGEPVRGLPYRGLWGEIDSASDIAAHEKRLNVPYFARSKRKVKPRRAVAPAHLR